MHAIRWIMCCSAMLWPLWGSAEIYQSRDASGNTVYSDRPLGTNSHKSGITAPPTGQSPTIPAAAPQDDKAIPAEDPELRKARCTKVRELLARYQKAEYLMGEGADGKNQILSDQEKTRKWNCCGSRKPPNATPEVRASSSQNDFLRASQDASSSSS